MYERLSLAQRERNADNYADRVLIAQTAIHIAFLLSAMAIAYTDRLMTPVPGAGRAASH